MTTATPITDTIIARHQAAIDAGKTPLQRVTLSGSVNGRGKYTTLPLDSDRTLRLTKSGAYVCARENGGCGLVVSGPLAANSCYVWCRCDGCKLAIGNADAAISPSI